MSELTVGDAGGTVSTIRAPGAESSATFPAASAVCTSRLYVPSGITVDVVSVQCPEPSLASWASLPSVNVAPLTVTCSTVAPPGVLWSQDPVNGATFTLGSDAQLA